MRFKTNNALMIMGKPKELGNSLIYFQSGFVSLKKYPGSCEYKIRGTEFSTEVPGNFIPVLGTPIGQ